MEHTPMTVQDLEHEAIHAARNVIAVQRLAVDWPYVRQSCEALALQAVLLDAERE